MLRFNNEDVDPSTCNPSTNPKQRCNKNVVFHVASMVKVRPKASTPQGLALSGGCSIWRCTRLMDSNLWKRLERLQNCDTFEGIRLLEGQVPSMLMLILVLDQSGLRKVMARIIMVYVSLRSFLSYDAKLQQAFTLAIFRSHPSRIEEISNLHGNLKPHLPQQKKTNPYLSSTKRAPGKKTHVFGGPWIPTHEFLPRSKNGFPKRNWSFTGGAKNFRRCLEGNKQTFNCVCLFSSRKDISYLSFWW